MSKELIQQKEALIYHDIHTMKYLTIRMINMLL